MRQKSRGVTTASTAEGGNNLIGEERLIGEALIPTQELVKRVTSHLWPIYDLH